MLAKTEHFDTDLASLAKQAKALSHPARLKILQVLAQRHECICGEIVDELPLSQASVSRHLRTLKEAGLIQGAIDGPRVCYCLNRETLARLREDCEAFFDRLDLDAQPDVCC